MKTDVSELAVFGNTPVFERRLHVGRPNIGDREKFFERVNDIFDSKWLSNNGPYVQEFERRLGEITGAKYCIAVSNATVGLEIAVRSAGLAGEVIVPSFTFVATAHALRWHGITPVFCDIDPRTHNLDPEQIESLITPNTSGIIGVHVWGRPCDIDALEWVAKKYRLKLLFDAAHAFGCSYQGQMIGNFGLAEVFSFHATKFINTFEGGAVVTNQDEIAEKAYLMRNFGFAGFDNVIAAGTNAKMSEVPAAMGLTNLDSMQNIVQVNRNNYQRYRTGLQGIPGVELIRFTEKEHNNFQHVIIVIDERESGVTRDHLAEILYYENVWVRRYFYPGCHQMEPYRSNSPETGYFLPETERLTDQVLSLPTGTDVALEDIDAICHIIRMVVEHGFEVSALLSRRQAQLVGQSSAFSSNHLQ